ncbi:MAG: ABC transporter permease [Actinomycetota bacterium]
MGHGRSVMRRYVSRRLLSALFLLVGLSFVTFAIFTLLPSADPALIRAGRRPTPELIEQIRESLGLDRSWLYQYGHFLNRLVFHFDLGYSFQNDVAVRTEIANRLPTTGYLAAGALALAFPTGLLVGTWSAGRRGTARAKVVDAATLFAISLPSYWLGLVMLTLLSSDGSFARLLPGQGSCVDFHPFGCAGSFVLPWIALGIPLAASYILLVRSAMLEILRGEHVVAARARGLTERAVTYRHGLRFAIGTPLSLLGVDLGLLLGGALLVESVFNLPGLGRYAVQSVGAGDLPAIQGTVLLGGIFIVLANLAADVIHAAIDPRVRDALASG